LVVRVVHRVHSGTWQFVSPCAWILWSSSRRESMASGTSRRSSMTMGVSALDRGFTPSDSTGTYQCRSLAALAVRGQAPARSAGGTAYRVERDVVGPNLRLQGLIAGLEAQCAGAPCAGGAQASCSSREFGARMTRLRRRGSVLDVVGHGAMGVVRLPRSDAATSVRERFTVVRCSWC
jgi:hypothetical protein